MKIIFLSIAVLLVWWIFRTLRSGSSPAPKPQVKNMVACEYCGLHIPEDEAFHQNDHTYCSKEHAQKSNS